MSPDFNKRLSCILIMGLMALTPLLASCGGLSSDNEGGELPADHDDDLGPLGLDIDVMTGLLNGALPGHTGGGTPTERDALTVMVCTMETGGILSNCVAAVPETAEFGTRTGNVRAGETYCILTDVARFGETASVLKYDVKEGNNLTSGQVNPNGTFSVAPYAMGGLTISVHFEKDGRQHESGSIYLNIVQKDDFTHGDGTRDNPYLIYGSSDFARLFQRCDEENYYKIMSTDIRWGDLWWPIGDIGWGDYQVFRGHLDGNNCTIRDVGFKFSGHESGGKAYVGMFSILAGSVKNLNIKNVRIELDCSSEGVKYYVGGIAGAMMGGRIENCRLNGDLIVTGDDYSEVCLGGIAGLVDQGLVDRCEMTGGKVSGTGTNAVIGGIVGTARNSTVTNCASMASVYSEGWMKMHNSLSISYAGGVVGEANQASHVGTCVFGGDLKAEGSRWLFGTTIKFGGICGAATFSDLELADCIILGNEDAWVVGNKSEYNNAAVRVNSWRDAIYPSEGWDRSIWNFDGKSIPRIARPLFIYPDAMDTSVIQNGQLMDRGWPAVFNPLRTSDGRFCTVPVRMDNAAQLDIVPDRVCCTIIDGRFHVTFYVMGLQAVKDFDLIRSKVVGLNLAHLPDKLVYRSGERIELGGLELDALYITGERSSLTTEDLSRIDQRDNGDGTTRVTLVYEDSGFPFTASFNVVQGDRFTGDTVALLCNCDEIGLEYSLTDENGLILQEFDYESPFTVERDRRIHLDADELMGPGMMFDRWVVNGKTSTTPQLDLGIDGLTTITLYAVHPVKYYRGMLDGEAPEGEVHVFHAEGIGLSMDTYNSKAGAPLDIHVYSRNLDYVWRFDTGVTATQDVFLGVYCNEGYLTGYDKALKEQFGGAKTEVLQFATTYHPENSLVVIKTPRLDDGAHVDCYRLDVKTNVWELYKSRADADPTISLDAKGGTPYVFVSTPATDDGKGGLCNLTIYGGMALAAMVCFIPLLMTRIRLH